MQRRRKENVSGMQVVTVLAGLLAAACYGVSGQVVDELRALVPMYARPDGELRAFWCLLRRAGGLHVSRECFLWWSHVWPQVAVGA